MVSAPHFLRDQETSDDCAPTAGRRRTARRTRRWG
ncbi:unnamed protein product [Musa acuminata subsp. malaccensis]|uniref:(wild Malaysian banana) hypothetical protein n=1 Tax=Musa acuminata subsp. malaccensis TaxID=214687 RepID=A0A804KFY4_MUSAM|nr:unnamed protein product [Musa acuminata subsp. malaccensis]